MPKTKPANRKPAPPERKSDHATRKPPARAGRQDETPTRSTAASLAKTSSRQRSRADVASANPPSASPTADEIRRARTSGRSVSVAIARRPRTPPLPDILAALLADALDAHARGHSVELVVNAHRSEPPNPYLILDRDPNDELTTQQAAAALRVSRPTIIKAIDEGRLPARMVGKHRRVRIYDFNAFARAEQAARAVHGIESTRLEQSWGLHEVGPAPTIEEWKDLGGRMVAPNSRAPRRKRG
ncbi:MAG: helix-turn-helix domain-containing protein [Phycisphaerales bacterium]